MCLCSIRLILLGILHVILSLIWSKAIWAGLEHPFVGEFLHNFKAGDQLFLVSRYYPGGQ